MSWREPKQNFIEHAILNHLGLEIVYLGGYEYESLDPEREMYLELKYGKGVVKQYIDVATTDWHYSEMRGGQAKWKKILNNI
jgi:hypothetical protein